MMQTFRASLALAFALVGPLALLPAEAPAQEGPTGVQVDQVRAERLSQTSPVIGRIVTRQQGRVAARVAGPVEEVAVFVGGC